MRPAIRHEPWRLRHTNSEFSNITLGLLLPSLSVFAGAVEDGKSEASAQAASHNLRVSPPPAVNDVRKDSGSGGTQHWW